MFEPYSIYWIYLFFFLAMLFSTMCISETIMCFLKHLGYPQSKKTKWYLSWVVFTIIFQIGFLSYFFQRIFFE